MAKVSVLGQSHWTQQIILVNKFKLFGVEPFNESPLGDKLSPTFIFLGCNSFSKYSVMIYLRVCMYMCI